MTGTYSQGRRWAVMSPVTTDRVLLGLCAAIWLALVGVSVAAIVALVDLGRGFHTTVGNSHTSAVLYVIIGVSALIILAAIPMLLRARSTASAVPVARSKGPAARSYPPTRGAAQQARTERPTALRSALPDTELDRIWLRGSVFLLGAMGLALVAVASATYLMAIGHQGASWTLYVIAGIVTVVMPLIPWRHVRRLRRMLAER